MEYNTIMLFASLLFVYSFSKYSKCNEAGKFLSRFFVVFIHFRTLLSIFGEHGYTSNLQIE